VPIPVTGMVGTIFRHCHATIETQGDGTGVIGANSSDAEFTVSLKHFQLRVFCQYPSVASVYKG
jgi:hypothetical protein